MTGRRERNLAQILDELKPNEVIVQNQNGGAYLFSRGATGRIRFNHARSINAIRSEIPFMHKRAVEIFAGKDRK